MLVDLAISGMVSSTYIHARIVLIVGFLALILRVIAGSIYLLLTIFLGQDTNFGIPTIIITMFFLGGIQLLFLDLIVNMFLVFTIKLSLNLMLPLLMK
jgi:dolichol-phosphate mannosyltransferase